MVKSGVGLDVSAATILRPVPQWWRQYWYVDSMVAAVVGRIRRYNWYLEEDQRYQMSVE